MKILKNPKNDVKLLAVIFSWWAKLGFVLKIFIITVESSLNVACNNNGRTTILDMTEYFSLKNKENYLLPELQIWEGIEDNSQIFFLKSELKHMLLPLIRTSETVLMMGHNIRFKEVIWEIIPKLFLLLLLVWSTGIAYYHPNLF